MTPINIEPSKALDLLLRSKHKYAAHTKDPETTRFRTASLATYHASATISLSHIIIWFDVKEEKKIIDRRNKLILMPCCSLSMLLQNCNTHAMLQHLMTKQHNEKHAYIGFSIT
jgi:hypothetical protein